MLLSDVVRVIGDLPLKEFPWGTVVYETINLFTQQDHQLNGDSTGQDIEAALGSLEESIRETVLIANLDIRRCCITAPAGGNMVIEYEEEPETDITVAEPNFCKALRTPLFLIVSLSVLFTVTVSAVMAGGLSKNQHFDWLDVIILFVNGLGIIP